MSSPAKGHAVPAYSLRRLRRRLLQALASATPAADPPEQPADDPRGRFLEPFWRGAGAGDLTAPVLANAPDQATGELVDAVLHLRAWAEARGLSQTFWRTYWTMLPADVVRRVRFRRQPFTGPAEQLPPWMQLLAPLFELRNQFPGAGFDAAMLGSDLRLVHGLDLDDLVYLPCPGDLCPLADELVHYEEAEDQGMPGLDADLLVVSFDRAADAWEEACRPVQAQRRRWYNHLLDRLPGTTAASDCLRAYCHRCLDADAHLPRLYAHRALQCQPCDPYVARLWAQTLTPINWLANPAIPHRLAGTGGTDLISLPVFRRHDITWSCLADYFIYLHRPALAGRYLHALHNIWPWDPATSTMLGLVAGLMGDDVGHDHWLRITARLDGDDGLYTLQLGQPRTKPN
jgi:hypothetical protein